MTAYNLSFGAALEAIKQGKAAAREKWTGASVSLYPGSSPFLNPSTATDRWFINGVDEILFNLGDAGTVTRLPSIIQHVSGASCIGWTPSQVDMLAEDWGILE